MAENSARRLARIRIEDRPKKPRGCVFAVRDFLIRFRRCTSVQGRILKGLAEWADPDGTHIFPGDRLLAPATYLPTRKLGPSIRYWLDLKVLVLVKPGRPRHAAEYRIDLGQLDSMVESSSRQDSIPLRNQDEDADSIPFDANSIPLVHGLDSAAESHGTGREQKRREQRKKKLAALAVGPTPSPCLTARRKQVVDEFDESVYRALLDFEQHRKRLRAPLTEKALELILKKLGQFKAQGMDPIEVLEQSIVNGWRGIFPLRKEGNGEPKSFDERRREKSAAAINKVLGRFEEASRNMQRALPPARK